MRVVLCGNKVRRDACARTAWKCAHGRACAMQTDLPQRQVSADEARAFATSNKFMYAEASAKSGENVRSMFDMLFAKCVDAALGTGGAS